MERHSATPACVLVENGECRARIVLNAESRPHCHPAICELTRGIAKSTGVRLFIDGGERSLEAVRTAPAAIRFELRPDPAGLGKDGFVTRVGPTALTFEAGHAAGFNNAVYTFLERHCGFRWLWPGEAGEVCDRVDVLRVPLSETREIPAFRWRHLLPVDMPHEPDGKWGSMEFHMKPSAACQSLFEQWVMRNRLGGLKALVGHTWGLFVNPDEYGPTHPEYFAEVGGSRQTSVHKFNGKHGGQLCTSHPGVVGLLVQRVRETFDRHPELDVISISPNDGTALCECDACLAVDMRYGNPPPRAASRPGMELAAPFKDDADATGAARRITGPVTDRMFEFANNVAARIAESHPDKLLLLLVYGAYRTPPRVVKLAGNVIAQYCVHCHEHWDLALRQAHYEEVAKLAAMTGEIGIYEYLDQGAWPGMPRLFPDLIQNATRFYARHGVRHFSTQGSAGFAANGFNLWFLTRALWDPAAEVDDLLQDYCRKAFGTAETAMRDYFAAWLQRWRECKGITQMADKTPFEQVLTLYPASFMTRVGALIEHARDAVEPLSPERGRIEFFGRALRGTEIALAAAAFSHGLRDQGWPLHRNPVITRETVDRLGPPEQVLATAKEALRLWACWEAFLESVRNEFVFSFFWARYCYDARRGSHAYYALQQIVELLTRAADSE